MGVSKQELGNERISSSETDWITRSISCFKAKLELRIISANL
jgi:hypothetical protein